MMKFCVVYCRDRRDKIYVIKKMWGDYSYLMYDLGSYTRLNKKLSSKRLKYLLRYMDLYDAIDFDMDEDFSIACGENYYRYYLVDKVRLKYIVDL